MHDGTIRGRGRSGRPWERAKAWVAANLPHVCHLCGYPIDMRADRKRHPLAFTVDHLTPLIFGGDPLDHANLRPAHRICGTSRGTKAITPEVRARCRHLVEAILHNLAPAYTRTL